MSGARPAAPVQRLEVAAYRIPTEAQTDGTLSWDATTLVPVTLRAGGCTGIGYTYAHRAAAMNGRR